MTVTAGFTSPSQANPRASLRVERIKRFALLAVALAVGAVPLQFLPEATARLWWADAYWALFQLTVAFKCLQTARKLEGNDRKVWLCFGLGCLAYAAGAFLWTWYELIAEVLSPIPSWSDLLFLSLPPCFLAGIWCYRNRTPSTGVTLVQLGNLGVIVFAFIGADVIFFFDLLQKSNNPGLFLANVAYAASNASVFFFGLVNTTIFLSGPKRSVMIPILFAVATLALADNVAAYWQAAGTYSSIDLFNLLYLLPFALVYWSACEAECFDETARFTRVTAELESRALQWGTLVSPVSVAILLAVAVLFGRRMNSAVLPYAGSALGTFVVVLALRDWWAQRAQNRLRSQALASEAHLKESEKRLLIKNEELSMANVEIWEEMKKRLSAQEELRHAQKMEALGQLTGGVAHDFNNLLAVIIGNLELMEQRSRDGDDLDGPLADAGKAADRGAALTQRLLAFSRKQALRPTSIDGGALLDEMAGMIERTLGAEISLHIHSGEDLWVCTADRPQLESAVLNLVFNARDAMREGGELHISASNASIDEFRVVDSPDRRAGEFVVFSVRDTGGGISMGIREKVFDPFFTTKELGAGTGLGLSMVHGFAHQSGGHVEINSEEGVGTEVRIYLPRSSERAADADSRRASEPLHGRGETLLVVDDEPEVRRLVVTLLTDLGYRVVEAADGVEARELLENLEHVDLLLSDVVLPKGISGRDLAREARELRSEIRVLLMSGFAGEHLPENGPAGVDEELIAKPFRRVELAERLRALLDAPARANPPS